MQVKPWRMFRGYAGSNNTLAWDKAHRGTLTFCKKESKPEERTHPYGSIRAIWVGDDGTRVTFETSHIEGLDEGDLPWHVSTRDVQGAIRVFGVQSEIPVTGEQIRMLVVGVSAGPKAR